MRNFNTKLVEQVKAFVRDEEGATAVEYGLMAALIALALVGALNTMTGGISKVFASVTSNLNH